MNGTSCKYTGFCRIIPAWNVLSVCLIAACVFFSTSGVYAADAGKEQDSPTDRVVVVEGGWAVPNLDAEILSTYSNELAGKLPGSPKRGDVSAGRELSIALDTAFGAATLIVAPPLSSSACRETHCCRWIWTGGAESFERSEWETKSCNIVLDTPPPWEWVRVAAEHAEDTGRWQGPIPIPKQNVESSGDRQVSHTLYRINLVLDFVALGLFFGLLIWVLRRYERPSNGGSGIVYLLIIIGVIAFIFRWRMGVWAYVHDFNHGPSLVFKMANLDEFWRKRALYGQVVFLFHSVFLWLGFPPERTVFAVNALVDSFTVVLVGLTARKIWPYRPVAALLAALCFALLPVHLRVAPSEITMSVHGFFTTAVLFAFVLLRREKHLITFVFFALTLFLAVQTREDANLLAPAAAAGFLLVRPEWGRWRDICCWRWIVVLLGVAWLPHLLFTCLHTLPQVAGQVGDSNRLFEFLFQEPRWGNVVNNLFVDPSVSFPMIPLLAFLGAWGLVRQNRRFGLWVLGTLAAIIALASLKTYTDVDRVLFHGQYQSWLALLVGGAVALFSPTSRIGRQGWRVFLMVAFVSVLIQPWWASSWIGEERLLQKEYRLERRARAVLPDDCRVIAFEAEHDPSRNFPPVMAYRPTWALMERRLVSLGRFLQNPADEIEEGACLVFYRSSACYTYAFDELDLGDVETVIDAYRSTRDLFQERRDSMEREECQEISKRYELRPVVELQVECPDWDGGNIPQRNITLGYYRLGVKKMP